MSPKTRRKASAFLDRVAWPLKLLYPASNGAGVDRFGPASCAIADRVAASKRSDSAKIIRNFIEDYHEKLEENFLFPRFKKAGKLVDLVDVLMQQHQAGRKVTDITMQFATNQALKNSDDRRKLVDSLRQFIRMYNPHEAREDTVLFPEFRKIVSQNEYDSLGEDFEKKEHELFGEDGFEKMVDKVASIEKKLGIYDLAQFTPKI